MLTRFFSFLALVSAVCVAANSPCFAEPSPSPAKKSVPKGVPVHTPAPGSPVIPVKLPLGIGGGAHVPSGTSGWKLPAGLTGSKSSGTSSGSSVLKPPSGTSGDTKKVDDKFDKFDASKNAKSGIDTSDKGGKTDKTGKAGKADKTGKAGKTDEGDKTGKSDKSDKTGKSGKTGKTDDSDKTGKSGKGGKIGKTGKTAKSDKTSKSDKSDANKAARIANPHQTSAFAWNNGAEWTPQGHFWGGGFWGPVPVGISAGTSVTVDPSSPGYTLFANYGLVEAPCDYTKRQVEVYGPDVSMVCAEPNALVPVGRYKVDYSTLSLEVTDEE